MKMRLIDAEALWMDIIHSMDVCDDILEIIEKQPTIEERKTGKWIDYSDEGYVECPFCHSATNCDDNIKELHFCFSCGADMRGEEDDSD